MSRSIKACRSSAGQDCAGTRAQIRVDQFHIQIKSGFWPEQREFITMIRKLILATLLGSFALTATACNTVKGLGRDIESVGQAGDDAM